MNGISSRFDWARAWRLLVFAVLLGIGGGLGGKYLWVRDTLESLPEATEAPPPIGDENADSMAMDRHPALAERPSRKLEVPVVGGPAPEGVPVPPPITEEEARERVIGYLGGAANYRTMEGDMSEAYAAARAALKRRGILPERLHTLAIADLTMPSYLRRLALYDPRTGEESRHLVAHGCDSGKLRAIQFSNEPGSHQSSPGLYRVGNRYDGEHGAALRLYGLEVGRNDQAQKREIVLHSAWYVSFRTMLQNYSEEGVPRIGRSHGCPVVPIDDLEFVLGKLQSGDYLYVHAKDGAGNRDLQ